MEENSDAPGRNESTKNMLHKTQKHSVLSSLKKCDLGDGIWSFTSREKQI